jgi:hypothetical protein
MPQGFRAIVLVVGAALGTSPMAQSDRSDMSRSGRQDHVVWVGEVLKRMQSIGPGMTRSELLTVFTTEGGLSSGLARTFVSRDCPYFKVDVEFEAVGRPSRDSNGRVTLVEGDMDRIRSISTPYLQLSVTD